MKFKRELSVGDISGLLGVGLAIVSLAVAHNASERADEAERARLSPSTFISSLVTVGGPRSDSPDIELASAEKLRQLSARGVRGLPFPAELVVAESRVHAEPNYTTGTVPRRVKSAYQWLVLEVTSGDCIRLTHFRYKILAPHHGPPYRLREINRNLSNPAGYEFICPDEGLLLPVGMFTVSTNPDDRNPSYDLPPSYCLIEYRSKTESALTKERCDDAFSRSTGLG